MHNAADINEPTVDETAGDLYCKKILLSNKMQFKNVESIMQVPMSLFFF